MQGEQAPEAVENGTAGTHGHTPTVGYNTGIDGDAVEYPWCIIEDGGISDRYATRQEAETALVSS